MASISQKKLGGSQKGGACGLFLEHWVALNPLAHHHHYCPYKNEQLLVYPILRQTHNRVVYTHDYPIAIGQ